VFGVSEDAVDAIHEHNAPKTSETAAAEGNKAAEQPDGAKVVSQQEREPAHGASKGAGAEAASGASSEVPAKPSAAMPAAKPTTAGEQQTIV
jgi:hypothetical protein